MHSPQDELTRKEAARYLTERGWPISHRSLANRARYDNAGGGPAFKRYDWGRVRYVRADLDAWLAQKLAKVVRVG